MAERLKSRSSNRGRRIALGASLVVVALGLLAAFSAMHLVRAARAAKQGKSALLEAEHALSTRNLDLTRQDLRSAGGDFARMRAQLRGLGPVLPVLRVVPLVRVQVRGIEAIADTGTLLADAGTGLSRAAGLVLEPSNPQLPTSAAVSDLEAVQTSLRAGLGPLDRAIAKMDSLNGKRLIGPLGTARRELVTRLPRIRARVVSAQEGLDALIAFSGVSGPRRYLIFTQNPEEVRPTGGYIGTYGVLDAQAGRLTLERYASIESWYSTHPQAVVAADQAPTPFQAINPPVHQTLANVNALADWPRAATLAADLWKQGGEQPVDGAMSFVPAFLARVLGALGPVTVPEYNETVTAANLVARTDFYTHAEGVTPPGADRKRFLVVLAQVVMQKLLDAKKSTWPSLGAAVGKGFDAREAMVWTTDSKVNTALTSRGWDGVLPAATGDFLANAEFAYTAKNGAGIKRTFDHVVTMRPDGSAHLATTLTIKNTAPADRINNIDSLSYITQYGPAGAHLADTSDPPHTIEPDLSGHPAAGWLRAAAPGGQTTLSTEWDAPGIAVRQPDGWVYKIRWVHPPGHIGDVLNLRVDLPAGFHWATSGPPATATLDQDFQGTWMMKPGPAPRP